MIYVDVTAACLLPLQSGIPRTTRGVYRLLNAHLGEKMTPIFWQPFRGNYTQLSDRALALLRDPFAPRVRSRRTPRDSTLPLLWASFSEMLGPWPPVVSLPAQMKSCDTLLLTSIFPDNRLSYLERLVAVPGTRMAIFHDAIPLHDPHLAGWEKKRHVEMLRLYSKMDAVIAVSHAAAHDLTALWHEYRIEEHPSVFVVPWPVSFTAPRPAFFDPPWEKKKVVYVSRLKKVKNHATLFDACAKLWSEGLDFDLEIIGCEDEISETRAILRAIDQLRAAGRLVSWRGHVTEDELHAAYRSATFTVFVSLAEGFGLPVIESFWHGRGVICGGDDAVGELTRNGGCLTTQVQNPNMLAMTMRTLLQDRLKCNALAREAYVRPLRTWTDYWRELEPILENR